MKDTAYRIVSESLKDELRAIDFYLLAADVAPTPAARLAARQFAREEEQHLDDLIEWIEWEDDPELRTVLRNIHLLQYDRSPQIDAVRHWVELCHQQKVSDPVRTLFEIALAKEQASLGHYHALERQVTEPLARRVLHTICQAEEQHQRFLEEQYHRLVAEREESTQSWH
jgi:rubrerythrin